MKHLNLHSWEVNPKEAIQLQKELKKKIYLTKSFKKIKNEPDIILFDGQGIAHPRRMGIATHLGFFLDKPTIGCAKSRLSSKYTSVGEEKGDYHSFGN